MDDVLAIVLGGGRGTRLFPLTWKRSKPAVPFGGKYRLIDVPVSNCINSRILRIFVLTQFNSESLNKHVGQTYKFDVFSQGFVSVLAAEQTEESESWFQGTADAVRRSLRHLHRQPARDILILSGDQLYRMDYRTMVQTHRDVGAEATVGVLEVPREQASQFGILKLDAEGRIVHFEEKPRPERLDALESDLPDGRRGLLASMGIYVFERRTLEQELSVSEAVDFGRHVIPGCIGKRRVQAHLFHGYWEDVGTIRSYYEASLALTESLPPFDFYDELAPIFTIPRFLPASKVEDCKLSKTLVSEGCIVLGADVERALLGIRTRVGRGSRIRDSLLLGADWFETLDDMAAARASGLPAIGIGDECHIEHAIVDKNARIGRGVQIRNAARIETADGPIFPGSDGPSYFIRDGVVVVPKGAVVPEGTII